MLGGHWHITLRHPSLGDLRSTLDIKFTNEMEFKAHSHRRAVRHMVGGIKASTAGVFSKKAMLKSGAFINMDKGTATLSDGELLFSAKLDMVVAPPFTCQGRVENGILRIPLKNASGQAVGIIEGVKANPVGSIDNYPAVVTDLMQAFENHIYDRRVLSSKAWKTFARKMTDLGKVAHDDLDLVFGFYTYSKKLPFTHKGFFRTENSRADSEMMKKRFSFLKGQVSLEEKTPETVVLTIKSFRCPGADVDSVMQLVLSRNYRNLIVDIRGNSGGALEGGMTLAKYLTPKEMPTGVYLTQKWFNQHPAPPVAAELAQMDVFNKPDVIAFLEELDTKGFVVLKVQPGSQQFRGNLFLLTDGRSASACEPLAWNMKHAGYGTVVGESTAGAMLSASTYPARNGFMAVIPNADYYTPTGERLDKVGVKPNVSVKSAEALEYVLEKLIPK